VYGTPSFHPDSAPSSFTTLLCAARMLVVVACVLRPLFECGDERFLREIFG
jgi:hypothetical protein